MEKVPFEDSVRTQWRSKNKVALFLNLLEFFPQLDVDEHQEIVQQLTAGDFDYLEVPHYRNPNDEVPEMILVFDKRIVYIDVLDPKNEKSVIETVKNKIPDDTRYLCSRNMTNGEWEKRIQAMTGIDPKDPFSRLNFGDPRSKYLAQEYEDGYLDEEIDDSELFPFAIPCAEDGYLDRTGFKLLARQPVLDWLNEMEKKHPSKMGPIEWSLEKINNEPNVYLTMIGNELLSPADNKKEWKRLKNKSVRNFFSGYYSESKDWPSITPKNFDQWFEIVQLGSIVDLELDE